jgi:hypothetical protein
VDRQPRVRATDDDFTVRRPPMRFPDWEAFGL